MDRYTIFKLVSVTGTMRFNMRKLMEKILFFFICVILAGCTSVKLVEKFSEEGQERFTIKHIGAVSDTIYHGLYTMWYQNGTKKLEVIYKNGKKEGLETLWDPFGTKIRETGYKDGKKNGVESYWDVRGNLKKKMYYLNGLQHGVETTFSSSGKKIKEELYKNGRKDGVEMGYDEQGRLVYQVLYKEGKKHGKESFFEYSGGSEPVVTEIRWENGEVVK